VLLFTLIARHCCCWQIFVTRWRLCKSDQAQTPRRHLRHMFHDWRLLPVSYSCWFCLASCDFPIRTECWHITYPAIKNWSPEKLSVTAAVAKLSTVYLLHFHNGVMHSVYVINWADYYTGTVSTSAAMFSLFCYCCQMLHGICCSVGGAVSGVCVCDAMCFYT